MRTDDRMDDMAIWHQLAPMVQCLTTLGTKPNEVASTITRFPHPLSHGVDKKLCPLLVFFESLGVPGDQLGKMLLLYPKIIYSIESKLIGGVEFFYFEIETFLICSRFFLVNEDLFLCNRGYYKFFS